MTATRVNEHRALAARFSAAAGTYERHASVQEQAAARVAALLADTPGPARILELGCGTGVLTRRLSRQFPRARIEAFDVAPGMVARCRARLRAAPNVRCAVADWTALPPALRYPLIVSSSALHWMHPLPDVLRALAARLAPGGRLVVAVMLRGTLAELRAARRRAAPRKRPARSLPSAPAVRRALEAAGLRVEFACEDRARRFYLSARHVLRHLHEQGVTGGSLSHSGRLLNRAELQRLCERYEARHRTPRGVQATYRIGYFEARAVSPE